MNNTTDVLIIDDDSNLRRALRRSLMSCGLVVEEAGDGPAGLELMCANRPRLVLLDAHLPRMDGAAVAQAMRANTALATIPVVRMTGEDGATAELHKPFDRAEMLRVLAPFLQGADGSLGRA